MLNVLTICAEKGIAKTIAHSHCQAQTERALFPLSPTPSTATATANQNPSKEQWCGVHCPDMAQALGAD
jgi:hypothetical protein